MMKWIAIAIASMVVISTAHHLGFVEKAYQMCKDIAGCAMCSTMWGTLLVLLLLGCSLLKAIALSFFVAFLSNWFGLLLHALADLYEKIWQRQRNKQIR